MKVTISKKEAEILINFLELDISRMKKGLTMRQCPENKKQFILELINRQTVLLKKFKNNTQDETNNNR
jgi:hypothetical protein